MNSLEVLVNDSYKEIETVLSWGKKAAEAGDFLAVRTASKSIMDRIIALSSVLNTLDPLSPQEEQELQDAGWYQGEDRD